MGKKEDAGSGLLDALKMRGIKRRDFLKYCGATAALLGLTELHIPKIAAALEKAAKRPPVIWLNFASCTGCTEAFVKASYPTAADVILDILSVDYNETIMAAAGHQVEEILEEKRKAGGYILIVEGGIPTKKGFGTIGGKEMLEVLKEMAAPAVAVVAAGSCAADGGLPSARPNPAQIIGTSEALARLGIKKPVINLDRCAQNPEYLVGVIVNYLLLKRLPEIDGLGRPVMYYGQTIHDNCERRSHYEAERFVEKFGTKEEELQYCLYKVGCKGIMTHSACPRIMDNGRTSWCIKAGAPCIGCAERGWTDKFAGFYAPLFGAASGEKTDNGGKE